MTRLPFLRMIAVLALTAWVFWGCLSNPFHFDDSLFLSSAQITEPGNVMQILNPAQGRQLTYLTYFLNYQIGQANPGGYHLVNLVLHFANVFCVFLFARLVLQGKSDSSGNAVLNSLPIVAAAVFALHPVQSEAVNYIYQRSTLLAALFSLASLCFFILHEKTRSPRRFLLISGGFYILAVASKETAFILPLAFLTYLWVFAEDWNTFKQTFLRARWLLLPLAALMLAGAGWALYWLYRMGDTTAGLAVAGVGPFQYFVSQMQVIVIYLRLLIWPSGLSVDHDSPIASFAAPYTWLCLFILLALVVVALRLRKQNPAVCFLALIFFIFLAPTSSIIPSADLIFEHRLYLPMIGASPLLAWGVLQASRLVVRPVRWQIPIWVAMMAIIVTGYAAVSRYRTFIWGDNVRLWEDAAAKAPLKARPHYNLGVACMTSNRERAREAFLKTIALRPDHVPALYNLGWLAQTSGRLDTAREFYRAALKAEPGHWQAHHNLGNIHVLQGDILEAIHEFEETIRLRGDYWPAFQSLGTLLIQLGRYGDAVDPIVRLKELRPELLDSHYLLAYALLGAGRVSEAEEELRILSLKDNKGDFRERMEELRRTMSPRPN